MQNWYMQNIAESREHTYKKGGILRMSCLTEGPGAVA